MLAKDHLDRVEQAPSMQDRGFPCIPRGVHLRSYAMRHVSAALVALASPVVIGHAALASARAAPCAAGDPRIVCAKKGALRRVVEGETVAFKGIPYPRPPVGGPRWKAPQAPRAWEGVRDGARLGAM